MVVWLKQRFLNLLVQLCFDNAALTAVKRANLPVAPEALTEDKYRFQIPIKMSRN